MSVLLFLILASLTLAVAALLGFVWAVKSGQFEDTCTPSMRVLMEETAETVKKGHSTSCTQLKLGVNEKGRSGSVSTASSRRIRTQPGGERPALPGRTEFAALARDAATKIE